MSESDLFQHGASTLAGIKPGSLISGSCSSRKELNGMLSRWNRLLSDRGIRFIPVKYMDRRTLVYVYRPAQLQKLLSNPAVQKFLFSCGYHRWDMNACIKHLIRRLQENEGFPHEIGIFLGYPLEDVSGFMKHQGKNFKYAGLWKVYGDVDASRMLFQKYRRCTEIMYRRASNGADLRSLTVKL